MAQTQRDGDGNFNLKKTKKVNQSTLTTHGVHIFISWI